MEILKKLKTKLKNLFGKPKEKKKYCMIDGEKCKNMFVTDDILKKPVCKKGDLNHTEDMGMGGDWDYIQKDIEMYELDENGNLIDRTEFTIPEWCSEPENAIEK